MAEYKEMLGKKFHIVQNGLDPDEVTEYLTKDTGSSDTVFQKLEQFPTLENMANTIEDAIKRARELAERAKAKAQEEAEKHKVQVIEDGKETAVKIINEAGKSFLTYFDNNSLILMQIMDEAFKKAREEVVRNRARTREQIEKGVWTEIDRLVKDLARTSGESSISKPNAADTNPTGIVTSNVSSTPSDPWQDAR